MVKGSLKSYYELGIAPSALCIVSFNPQEIETRAAET